VKKILQKFIINNTRGITLLELIVAMTIFLVVITLAVGGFVSLIRLQSQTQTMTDVQQNGRIAIEQITRLARQAESVDISGTGDIQQIVFDSANCFTVVTVDGVNRLKKFDSDCTSNGLTLSSDDVNVTKFYFVKNPGVPARLDINITVKSVNDVVAGGDPDVINLNTSVLLIGLE